MAHTISKTAQAYTSASTSINSTKVPAVFRKVNWAPNEINLDYGGGKFDTATEYLRAKKVGNIIIDPYNRTEEHNREAEAEVLYLGGADSATLSNVLNVIDSEFARFQCLHEVRRLMKTNAPIYITVYEGDRSGVGKMTKKDCWQNNRKLHDYLDEVRFVFGKAFITNGMIVAYR